MQAVVDLEETSLGLTALFGSVECAVSGTVGQYVLDTDVSLPAQDFALVLGAAPMGEHLKATLQLRGIATLPLALPPLDIPIAYEVSAAHLVLRDLERIEVEVPASTDASLPLRLCAARLTIALGAQPWTVSLAPLEPGKPVAIVALGDIVFHVTELALAETGITHCSAHLLPGSASLAGRPINLHSGSLSMQGPRMEANIQADMSLDGFIGSRTTLSITAGRTGQEPWHVAAMVRAPSLEAWSDPSGLLHFEQMSLAWSVVWDDSAFTGKLSASGRVRFTPTSLSGPAREWFGQLFSGLAADFDGVDLGDWASDAILRFNPLQALRVKALDLFDMHIPAIAFGRHGLDLSGLALSFHGGGASIRATLPSLRLKLDGTPRLEMTGLPSLNVELTVPAGIKAYGTLEYQESSTLQSLTGRARFSTPTLPGVEVMFKIGRARFQDHGEWEPLLLLYADVPVNIAVFPGVVVQRLALGAGLNFQVAGVTGLSFAAAEERVRLGSLPDVAQPNSWQPERGGFTLAARAFAGPLHSSVDTIPQLYLADLTFVMASDFQLAAYLRMWFQTSLADGKSARFQGAPSVVALANFDGNEPSLRLIAMTKKNGASTQPGGTSLLGLDNLEVRLAFEANSRGMAIVLGPNRIEGAIGPLRLRAETLLAIRAGGGNALVLYRAALEAGFQVGGSLDLGLVRFSASVHAGFSAQLELWGCFDQGALTVYGAAHAAFELEVALHVRIGFEVRIDVLFGSITIQCYQHFDFGLRVHIDLDLQVALSTRTAAGARGSATVAVSVLGMTVGVPITVSANEGAVDAARALFDSRVKGELAKLGVQ